ncbi:MAG: hypothetical protein ACR2HR_16040 [Euzebya sp.]
MHPHIHQDHALSQLVTDNDRIAKARKRKELMTELALAEGATSRELVRGAARRTKQGAAVAGAAGVLLAPQLTGVAAATENTVTQEPEAQEAEAQEADVPAADVPAADVPAAEEDLGQNGSAPVVDPPVVAPPAADAPEAEEDLGQNGSAPVVDPPVVAPPAEEAVTGPVNGIVTATDEVIEETAEEVVPVAAGLVAAPEEAPAVEPEEIVPAVSDVPAEPVAQLPVTPAEPSATRPEPPRPPAVAVPEVKNPTPPTPNPVPNLVPVPPVAEVLPAPVPPRVDPAATPQAVNPSTPATPQAATGPVIAVHPAMNPNQRPEPVEQVQELTLNDRVTQAQQRPVDRVRVDHWSQAVIEAWTLMQSGQQPSEEDVVAFDEVAATPTLGWSYEIQPGDNLWTVSERLWGTSDLSPEQIEATWQLIYTWNADRLGSNPDKIPANVVIQIPIDIRDGDGGLEA